MSLINGFVFFFFIFSALRYYRPINVFWVSSSGGFEDSALYTSWLPPQEAFSVWKSPLPFNKYEKSATLVSNSQALLRPLDNMVGKAWNMFASK